MTVKNWNGLISQKENDATRRVGEKSKAKVKYSKYFSPLESRKFTWTINWHVAECDKDL